ncbi:MAG: HIRAN domain-containing protein [Desulfobacterales bacterium]|nr:HIRAN domain-containing protein [Desulfobacterales bacterium]MDD4402256.1 HIRAN domain-containing protein [Desulfitobacteriaceae bacterium]
MTVFKKLIGLFGKNTENTVEDCRTQSKPTITTAAVSPSYTAVASPRTFDVTVVGVHYYQEALQRICNNRRENGVPIYEQATLVPENDNPEDANAVRIDIEGETVGYLSRRKAAIWRGKMISENSSGTVKCPAQIFWDRNYVAEGSYWLLLDIDLSLPDSKIEPGSAGRMWQSPGQPDHVKFLVNQLNRFELSHCKVGDPVGLWDVPGTREIFIYRQGTDFGEGKLGICPEEACKIIRKFPGCDASIASIYEGGCKIDCRIISKAEMTERMRRVKEKEKAKRAAQEAKLAENLRVDFDRKYSPKTAIKATFHLIYHSKLAVGDSIYLGIKSKKFYLRYPRQLRVDLLNQAKEKIGEIRNKEPVLRIIKAFYNGYDFDLEVEALYGIYTQYDVEFDPCVGETVRYATVAIVPKKEGRPNPAIQPTRYTRG